ncbi:MAG: hypothetical protein VX986_07410 [Pseudomonadota bacterium]|nr:hypothetical protein [Pseudomonadota bacterium]
MDSRTPILVGSAQYVDRLPANLNSLSPTDISFLVAEKAITDSAKAQEFKQSIDILVSARLFQDSVKGVPMWPNPYGGPDNLPGAIANRLGISPIQLVYAEVGGETPQRVVNQVAEKIYEGNISTALLTGSEALLTIRSGQKAGLEFDWTEEIGGDFDDLWPHNPMSDDYEAKHGITFPIQVYALLEQVRRNRLGLSQEKYRSSIAELLMPFSLVASRNPYAQFPKALTEEFIANFSEENFPICEPYSKWMVAQDAVNQGAAVVMTSVAKAIEFDIPESQWIFLKSYSDYDELQVTQRPDLSRSPAQGKALSEAMDLAGLRVEDLSFIDLYSCFPIAVWTACESLGLSTEMDTPLTVTGGLPFFGGPGNNYSLHAIAEVVQLLRGQVKTKSALIAANGGYLSKHSVGIYSNSLDQSWDSGRRKIDTRFARQTVSVKQKASGVGSIESYAATYKKGKKNSGFIVGRLDDDGKRFLAVPNPEDSQSLAALFEDNPIGKTIHVQPKDSGLNFFSLK